MQIDENKLARQKLGVDLWFNNKCNGIFNYHTGVGKTFTAFLCIKRLETIQKGVYVIAVPGKELEKQWKDKIKNSFPKNLVERIIVKTAHSLLLENLTYEVDTYIIDEIHEFSTEEREKLLNKSIIKFTNFIGLTASADDKNFRKILKYFKVIDTISAEEAKEKGYVAEFIEYNLGLHLTEKEKEAYKALTEIISKHLPKFQNNLDYAQKVLSGGKDQNGVYYSGAGWAWALAQKNGWKPNLNLNIENHRLIDNLWNPSNFIGYAKSLINAIRGRKNLLCNAKAKYNTVLELLNKFNNVKTIIFSESTDFADKVGKILNDNKHPTVVYHSNLKSTKMASPKTGKFIVMGKIRLKKLALEKIKSGKARVLSTAKSLDRGLDVVDLRMGITASGTQNSTQYKQRNGRAGRKEEGIFADLPVLLINLYIVDTQDEIWLENRQSKANHKPIVVNSVEEINYYPPANIEFTIKDL